MSAEEPFPVHASVEILDAETIFKSKKWWMACLRIKLYGRSKYKLYMWMFENGFWHTKQTITITNRDAWNKVKEVIERMMQREGEQTP